MPEWLIPALTQGGLGVTAAIFIRLYLVERKTAQADARQHNDAIDQTRKAHYTQLDEIRETQIAREREVAQTLDEYGRSVVEAIERTAMIVEDRRRNQ